MGVKAVFHGGASADPEIQAIVDEDIRLQSERILDAVEPHREPSPLAKIAVRSWLQFLRNAAHEWLDTPDISRDEIRDLVAHTLVATLAGAARGIASLGRRHELPPLA